MAEAENKRLREALARIASMKMPPTGWSAYVGLMKEIARAALSQVEG